MLLLENQPMTGSLLVIADVSNLYYCIKNKYGNQRRLDYRKFLSTAGRFGSDVYKAVAYGSSINSQADQFRTALRKMGFQTKYKSPKILRHEGREERKADWDVGITIDIVEELQHVSTVILGSADGDMAPCVRHIREQGRECHIIACGISYELVRAATSTTEITEDMLT